MSFAKNAMMACKALSQPLYDTPKSVQQTIPIYKIAADGIFQLENKKNDENKRYDKAYLFLDTNYSLKSEAERETFLKVYCQFLNSMNVSFKICIMNLNRNMGQMQHDIFINTDDPDYKALADSVNSNIERCIQEGRNGIEQIKIFVVTCERQSDMHARDFFRTIEANVKANFNRMESGLVPLNAEERLRYLHSFYRLGKEEEYNFHFEEAVKKRLDWRDSICNSGITHYADEKGRFDGITLQYDKQFVRVLYAQDLPNNISDEFLNMLTSISFHTITTLDVAPIPQEIAMKRLFDLYMANGRSIERQQEQRNKARAYSSDISYDKRKEKEEIESYMDIMTENDERLFYLGIYVTVIAQSKEELEANVLSLVTMASNYSLSLEPAWWNQMNALNTCLPVGARFCDTMRPVFTQPLCAFMPFNVQELYHKKGIFYGVNQVSKNIIVGDRTKLMNPHGFVLGTTGGGKGFDVKSEMTQVVLRGEDDVIVIDPQNEYVPLAQALKGEFIDVSVSSNASINPMDIDTFSNFASTDAFINDKTELMLGIAEQILKHEITMGQKSIVGRCVKIVYEDYFNTAGKGRKNTKQSPTMVEFYNILKNQPEVEAKDLKLAFEIFVEGSLNFFAKPTNVNTKNRFLIYGINNLGDDLASVGQLVMLESIRARIIRNFQSGVVTWLYIDEFHNLTKTEFSLRYLSKIWKEVRKLGGICTGITQNILDLLDSEEVQKMLGNSQYISLLNQGDNEIHILADLLGLSEELIEFLRGADSGCGVLRFGDKKYIPRKNEIPKDSELYAIFNTDFHEMKRGKRNRRKELEKELTVLPRERQHTALAEPAIEVHTNKPYLSPEIIKELENGD